MRKIFANRGISMAIALLTLALISVIAFGLGAIGIRNMNESASLNYDALAFRAAQAGVQYASYQLNNQLNGWQGFGNPLSNLSQGQNNQASPYTQPLETVQGGFSAYYWSNLLTSAGNPTNSSTTFVDPALGTIWLPASSIAIVSTGGFNTGIVTGGVERRIVAILKWKNPFNLAIGTVNQLNTSGSLTTDSYNSNYGSYDAYNPKCSSGPPCGYDGNVGSNCPHCPPLNSNPALTIGGSATIYGSGVVGLGGTVSGATSTNPSNGWVQCKDCVDTTLVNSPSLPNATSGGTGYGCTGGPPCSPSDSSTVSCSATPLPPNFNYGNLTVSSAVYLVPGDYSFNSINIGIGGTLYACIDSANPTKPVTVYLSNGTGALPNSPYELYLFGGAIRVIDGTSGTGNDVEKAPNLLIFGNVGFNNMFIKSGNYQYTWFLHAPDAQVTNTGAGTINAYGSMIVNSTGTLRGHLYLHADDALMQVYAGKPVLIQSYSINY